VGNDAIAVGKEEHHLRIPVVGREWPAVAEHDRLPLAPILVEDLNAVFGGDGGHLIVSVAFARVCGGVRGCGCANRRDPERRSGGYGGAANQNVASRESTAFISRFFMHGWMP
jgi:hypothetical protein